MKPNHQSECQPQAVGTSSTMTVPTQLHDVGCNNQQTMSISVIQECKQSTSCLGNASGQYIFIPSGQGPHKKGIHFTGLDRCWSARATGGLGSSPKVHWKMNSILLLASRTGAKLSSVEVSGYKINVLSAYSLSSPIVTTRLLYNSIPPKTTPLSVFVRSVFLSS